MLLKKAIEKLSLSQPISKEDNIDYYIKSEKISDLKSSLQSFLNFQNQGFFFLFFCFSNTFRN